jgi:hypothetical protein
MKKRANAIKFFIQVRRGREGKQERENKVKTLIDFSFFFFFFLIGGRTLLGFPQFFHFAANSCG